MRRELHTSFLLPVTGLTFSAVLGPREAALIKVSIRDDVRDYDLINPQMSHVRQNLCELVFAALLSDERMEVGRPNRKRHEVFTRSGVGGGGLPMNWG